MRIFIKSILLENVSILNLTQSYFHDLYRIEKFYFDFVLVELIIFIVEDPTVYFRACLFFY